MAQDEQQPHRGTKAFLFIRRNVMISQFSEEEHWICGRKTSWMEMPFLLFCPRLSTSILNLLLPITEQVLMDL